MHGRCVGALTRDTCNERVGARTQHTTCRPPFSHSHTQLHSQGQDNNKTRRHRSWRRASDAPPLCCCPWLCCCCWCRHQRPRHAGVSGGCSWQGLHGRIGPQLGLMMEQLASHCSCSLHCVLRVCPASLLAVTHALHRHGQLQLQAGSDACSTCKFAVSLLSDLLCDPYVDNTMVSSCAVVRSCEGTMHSSTCMPLLHATPTPTGWHRRHPRPTRTASQLGDVAGVQRVQPDVRQGTGEAGREAAYTRAAVQLAAPLHPQTYSARLVLSCFFPPTAPVC
jgi:hypothetical protein